MCARPGVCEKCAEGLFGFGWLELADGGQRCINHAQRAWLLVYATFGFAAVALLVYSAMLARRPAVNKEVLRRTTSVEFFEAGGRISFEDPFSAVSTKSFRLETARSNVLRTLLAATYDWQELPPTQV